MSMLQGRIILVLLKVDQKRTQKTVCLATSFLTIQLEKMVWKTEEFCILGLCNEYCLYSSKFGIKIKTEGVSKYEIMDFERCENFVLGCVSIIIPLKI